MAAIPEPTPQTAPSNGTILDEKVAALTVSDETTNATSSKASETTSVADTTNAPAVTESSKTWSTETPKADEIFKLPIAHPLEDCKPAPQAELNADQEKKYESVLTTVKEWTEIPNAAGRSAPKSPITDDERMFLTRDCILRYLRATKWNVNYAIQRLQDTLTWRREYGMEKITMEHTSPENETGKQVITGYDVEGRPCLYQDPSKQNTTESERQVHHLVYLLERAIDIMPPGQETLALVINFKNSSRKTNPSMSMSRNVLNILQTYYPERLGRALISELPWYVTYFFKLITPFIDPVTRTKLRFNEPFESNIPRAQLLKTWGGEANFEYEHDVYWPALDGLAKQRRAAYKERWVARGKNVGDDEWVLKGGEPKQA